MSQMANLKHSLCSYFKMPIRDNFSLQKRILSVFMEISIGKKLFFSKQPQEDLPKCVKIEMKFHEHDNNSIYSQG